jgi:hypothetical protein
VSNDVWITTIGDNDRTVAPPLRGCTVAGTIIGEPDHDWANLSLIGIEYEARNGQTAPVHIWVNTDRLRRPRDPREVDRLVREWRDG